MRRFVCCRFDSSSCLSCWSARRPLGSTRHATGIAPTAAPEMSSPGLQVGQQLSGAQLDTEQLPEPAFAYSETGRHSIPLKAADTGHSVCWNGASQRGSRRAVVAPMAPGRERQWGGWAPLLAVARWLAARRRRLPPPAALLAAAVAVSVLLLASGLWHTTRVRASWFSAPAAGTRQPHRRAPIGRRRPSLLGPQPRRPCILFWPVVPRRLGRLGSSQTMGARY